MRPCIVAFSALMLTATCAAADFDLEIVCTAWPLPPGKESRIDPKSFVSELFAQVQLTPERLGIQVDEINGRYEALLAADYCKERGVCKKNAEAALFKAKNLLRQFWHNSRQRPTGDGFWFTPNLPSAVNGNPVEQERRLLNAFFKGTADVKAICVSDSKGANDSGTSSNGSSNKKDAAVSVWDGIRIRKEPTGLKVAQRTANGKISADFKKVDAASFTASRDYLEHSNTFNIDAVLGYSFGPFALRKDSFEYAEVIPYVRYSRLSIQSSDPDAKDVRNIGGGVVSSFYFIGWGGRFNHLEYYPEYIHSTRSGANVLSQNIVLTPGLAISGFDARQSIPGLPLSFFGAFQIKAVYGNVFNDGGDPALRDSKQYERLGPKLQIWIYGDDAPFNGWSWSASYEYLKTMRGPMYAVRRFETTLSYTLPQTEFWSLDLKYINGRNLETLEEQQQITLGLGLKY